MMWSEGVNGWTDSGGGVDKKIDDREREFYFKNSDVPTTSSSDADTTLHTPT